MGRAVTLAAAAALLLGVALSAATAPGGATPEKRPQVVLSWHREGGFAGFCDDLAIDEEGGFVASRCGRPAPRILGVGRLSPEQREQLERWGSRLASFTWEHTDPAAADAMTVRLELAGRGDRPVSAEERAAMLELASTLYGEQLSSGESR